MADLYLKLLAIVVDLKLKLSILYCARVALSIQLHVYPLIISNLHCAMFAIIVLDLFYEHF